MGEVLGKADALAEIIEVNPATVSVREGMINTAWHHHDQHQLLYARNGIMHIRTEKKAFILPVEHGVWIPAHAAHSLHASSASLQTWLIYLQPEADEAKVLQDIHVFPIADLAREMILYTGQLSSKLDRPGLQSDFFSLLKKMMVEWCRLSLSLELPLPRDPLIEQITIEIQDNLDRPLYLELIAKHYGMSGRTLIRQFKKELGMTFREYVRVARVAKAVELLSRPSASVTEVAYTVGYRSLSSFIHAFQSLVGKTPGEYLLLEQEK